MMKNFSILLAVMFISTLGLMAIGGFLPVPIVLFYIGISVVTYLVYWWDKSAALKGSWRTSESTLHLLAVAGGWPGALVAQQILRHKTQKRSFRLMFWLTILSNVALFVLLFAQGYLGVFSRFL